MIKKIMLYMLCCFSMTLAFAHGEDKKGPNGGFVRMPGAFHTELVLAGKNKIKIFLLDIDWKNPSVLKSNIQVSYSGQTSTDGTCAVQKKYFLCSFPKSVNLYKKGELKITAQREEQKGNQVIYVLPLKLEKSVPPPVNTEEQNMDHSSHH